MAGLITAAGSLVLNQIANAKATSGSGLGIVAIPDPTKEEQKLLDLQKGVLEGFYDRRAEEEQLRERLTGYENLLMSDNILTDEESAMFDEEYNNQLAALQEQFGIETERTGAARLADLASRGVLETTTGENILAEDAQSNAYNLSQSTAELLNQKEVSRAEAERAKREMALQGYNLVGSMLQSRQMSDLSDIGILQDYQSAISRLTSTNRTDSIIRENALNQYKYKQNLANIGKIAGAGAGGLG